MAKRKTKKTIAPTHVTATNSSTNIRIEEPKTHSRRPKQHDAVSVIISSPNDFVGGFIGFLREHAIVGLAVGFVIGTQVQTVVKQLVASFIGPMFQLFFGQNLDNKTGNLHFHGRSVPVSWGAFVYVLLNFVFVLVAIYAIIKIFNLDKLDKPPTPTATATTTITPAKK